MRQKDKDTIADVLMSLTLIEAALAEFQATIDREREIMRTSIKEGEAR